VLYGALLWRFALACTRAWPEKFTRATLNVLAAIYWTFARQRRAVLRQNLLPLVNHDPAAAAHAEKKLRQNFSRKLADLWRHEAGLSVAQLVEHASGWENFLAAQKKHHGVLFVTPHLGNWEFGALIMRRRGLSVHAISLAEPSRDFTELRRAARARTGVETLVIGEDPFGAVQIIRVLEAGGTVALLLDRPPVRSAVTVNFCGQDFPASVAAAEFARASGCALLPTYIVWRNGKYEAHILPAVDYDRPALRDRSARHALTQEILRAFESIVRQHPDQWYHFVPVWPEEKLA
jgi:KDO2-lipid IV(A) lauroyltransferase